MEEEDHDDHSKHNFFTFEEGKTDFQKAYNHRKDSTLTLDYFNTMIMPNLSGMVVLEEPNNDLRQLDLNYFSSEPLDINLNRLFQEDDGQGNIEFGRRKTSCMNSVSASENPNSCKSLLSDLNNLIYKFLNSKKLEDYDFFMKVEGFKKNIGNLSYLDSNLNGWLRNQLLMKFDSLLQSIYKSSKLDSYVDMVMNILKMSLEISMVLMKLIKQCDGEYCMDVLKTFNSENSNRMQTETLSQNQSFNASNSNDDHISSQSSRRKNWCQQEKDELKAIMRKNYPEPPFKEDLDLFAKKFGRTDSSITNQIQKLRKEVAKEHESSFMNFYSQNIQPVVVSSITPLNLNSANNMTIEQMIIDTLQNLPDQQGYKRQILENLNLRFDMKGESWGRSFSQTLSNSKRIIKIKGTYSLKESFDELEFPNDSNDIKTLKKRVFYILHQQPNQSADKTTILNTYLSYWGSINRNDKELGISILKILRQNFEIDSSKSKTRYKLT